MSNRFYEYDKGSSRSARDDSRTSKTRDRQERDQDSRERRRTRSRSPKGKHSPPASSRSRHSSEGSRSRDRDHHRDDRRRRRSSYDSHSDSEEDVPAPPPPPRISKISMGFAKPSAPIKMSLPTSKAEKPKMTVASVFNTDDDDEPEEMPAEAKMRMRNVGRETPTSAGPNSFGKTKQGFCDSKKVFEKNLKQALDTTAEKPQLTPRFPQTIYRINPSSS